MAGGGTGQPLWFCCSKCRRRWGYHRYHDTDLGRMHRHDGYRHRVVLTGRERVKADGRSHGRSTNRLREYTCKDCGHTGWSRHNDLVPHGAPRNTPRDA